MLGCDMTSASKETLEIVLVEVTVGPVVDSAECLFESEVVWAL